MFLKRLDIENFRGITKASIDMDRKVTIFCGVNGAGKTTLLDAISHHLSWFILKVRRSSQGGSGDQISLNEIKNGSSFAKIQALFKDGNEHFSVTLTRTRSGYKTSERSDMKDFSILADSYKQKITDAPKMSSLPILVYYSVQRNAEGQVKRIRTKHPFDILSTFDNALKPHVNFRTFFEWYRTLEDIENEQYRDLVMDVGGKKDIAQNPQLKIVREVIEKFTGFKKLTIKRNPLRMQLEKNGQILSVEQLSQGERDLLALVGDLTRRIVIANPAKADPLEGEGIVLIDEIELHLHPKWQREVLHLLSNTFVNVQFVVTTHSPQILSEAERYSIMLFYQKDGEFACTSIKQGKGLSSNEILEEIMDTKSVNQDVQTKLDRIFRSIDDNELEEAKKQIEVFKATYGSIPEIVRSEALLSFYATKL
ncbi:MAG: AAA family ATPase [Sphaerochaeta sp.]|nr:AAA family ATPase [Sphaerochaeta sp.]